MSKIDLNISEDQVVLLRLAGQIKSIQSQLDRIRAELLKLSGVELPESFADFYGIIKGSDTPKEDIDAVLYRNPKAVDDPVNTAG